MNTQKYKRSLRMTLMVLPLFFVGCSDYLDVAPDMRTELDSPEKVGELLATAYPQANYIPFTEAISDNVGDKGSGSAPIVNKSPYFFEDIKEIDQDSPTFYWNAAYTAIAAANHALQAIEKAGDTPAYSAYKGEALVARAYAHFMLVTLFSQLYEPGAAEQEVGIPYVTEVENVVIKEYKRGTLAEVYKKIEDDLTQGLPLLNDDIYKSAKYHFTKAAANAFASRFYLFKQDYAKVVEHANQVLGSVDVASKLRQINSVEYLSYQYNELQAQYTRADNPANILLVEAPSIWGRAYAGYRYSLDVTVMNKVFYAGNVTGGTWAYGVYGTELSLNIPKFREHFVRQDLHAETGIAYNIIPLFTMEEVLFNRAEAQMMLGNEQSAIDDLNTYASTRFTDGDSQNPKYLPDEMSITKSSVLNFYGTMDIKEALKNCILDFKRANFIHEGMRWFDLLRHKIGVVHKTKKGETLVLGPNDPMRLFQIPQEAQSSGLELNPR